MVHKHTFNIEVFIPISTNRGILTHKCECGKVKDWKKKIAHYQVQHAINKGLIIRPKICSECGKASRVIAHHFNYDKPLDIIWLCSSCHRLLHIKGNIQYDTRSTIKLHTDRIR